MRQLYAYFIVVSLASSLIFWGSSVPQNSISYVDSLFLVVSAITEAGLNTVNLSQMTTWQQVLLWLLIILGSSIWVSIWTVLVRKHTFERRFKEIVKRDRERRTVERRNTTLSLLPIRQRLRSLTSGRDTNAPTLDPSRLKQAQDARAPLGMEGEMPLISGPTNGRLVGSVAPPQVASSEYIMSPVGSSLSNAAVSEKTGNDESAPTERESNGAVAEKDEGVHSVPPTQPEHIAFAEDIFKDSAASIHRHGLTQRRPQADGTSSSNPAVTTSTEVRHWLSDHKVGRNGQFHGLTQEQREKLGGTEYRALRLLSVAVPLYFFAWQFLGSISLGAWISRYQPQPALGNGVSPWWNGIFNGVSAFNNSGMSVLDLNMIPYAGSYFVLIVMGAMILAGNTAYPVFLRLSLWTSLKALELLTYPEDLAVWKETLRYILKYPRRVYTNLFPSRQTWWLVFMLLTLNGIDWAAYELLNFGNGALEKTSVGDRAIDGLFQATAVRSGGFYVVSIPTLYIGLQVLYVIMMYIAVYPVVITMRHSNVYEERSLGIYDNEDDDGAPKQPRDSTKGEMLSSIGRMLRHTFSEWHGVGVSHTRRGNLPPNEEESRISFINHQIRGQLSHDLWWLTLAVLFITIIETRHFLEDPVTYSVFNIIFEVVSAYGSVGISVGLPYAAYSLSGGFYPGSKLILCAVMLRGRHRGLPVALDRAVRLPGEEMHRVEEEDHAIRRSMSINPRPSHVTDMSDLNLMLGRYKTYGTDATRKKREIVRCRKGHQEILFDKGLGFIDRHT
ncbi:TrkH-domain-containing protein [Xylariaceae sp. FL0255]|nr:TrkH-domain-containing protein [Xylariaceae sp. FL0255]